MGDETHHDSKEKRRAIYGVSFLRGKPLMCTILFVLLVRAGCRGDAAQNMRESLKIETVVREFGFLAPGEVAVDVAIKNVGNKVIIIDYRTERARSQMIGSQESQRIIMPLDLLDCLSFHCVTLDAALAKEERTSDVNRHRSALEEGGLMRAVQELVVLPPGYATSVHVIIWSDDREVTLRDNAKQVEVRFGARVLMVSPEEVQIEQNPLVGAVLKDYEKWLSRKYVPVSATGQINLEQRYGR